MEKITRNSTRHEAFALYNAVCALASADYEAGKLDDEHRIEQRALVVAAARDAWLAS